MPPRLFITHAAWSAKPYVSSGLGPLLHDLGPPAFYLDFETISPVIPIYAGMSPYQTIPFQWSIHYVDDHGARGPPVDYRDNPQHHALLHKK